MSKSRPKRPTKKRPKKSSPWLVTITALITIVAGIALFLWIDNRVIHKGTVDEYTEIEVFFSNKDGKTLKGERRLIKKDTLEEEIKEAINTLIHGSKTGLINTIPKGTRLLDVRIKDNTAYIDLSKEIIKNHPGGSSYELQTIYSIVNTVCLNFPVIKEVQILVEGRKEETLAGHIGIGLPLPPDPGFIKG